MGNEQDAEEGVFCGSAVPAIPLYTEKWHCGLCGNGFGMLFFVYVFGFVLFMLRANLTAHCSRIFRDGMR